MNLNKYRSEKEQIEFLVNEGKNRIVIFRQLKEWEKKTLGEPSINKRCMVQ